MTRNYRVYVFVIALVCITFFTATATAQNSQLGFTDENVDDNPLQRDAAEYAEAMGVSLEEAIERINLQAEIGKLNADLSIMESDTFAGLYVLHNPDFKIIVRFTEGKEDAVQSYITEPSLVQLIEVQGAEFTLQELESVQDEAMRKFSELEFPIESGISLPENRVEVYVTEQSADSIVLQELVSQLPKNIAMIPVEELSSPAADIYAGLALSQCTSGFSVISSSGTKGISTAGHCSDTLSYNNQSLPFRAGAYSGTTDAQWHEAPGFTVRNLTYDGTYNRYIYGTKLRSNQYVGEWVCKYGKTTKYGCGEIIDKNYAPSYVPNAAHTFIRVRRWFVDLSDPGDSGGPWFSGNTAYGIMSGEVGIIAVYMAVDYFGNLPVTVLTQ